MEIGPIQRVTPLAPITGPRPATDLSRVFASEFAGQQHHPSDTPERASRGAETDDEDFGEYTPEFDADSQSAVNLMA